MGGRGASSGGGRAGTFKNSSEFEKSLTGANDPRIKEYSDAFSEESQYNQGLKSNMERAINEDGFSVVENAIQSELRSTRNQINSMPDNKTPTQLGMLDALQERVQILKDLQRRRGEVGRGRGNVDII